MLLRHASSIALALFLGVALGEACIGPGDSSAGACENFGGTCVPSASADLCGGTLPYQCSVGVCCDSILPGPPDATIPVADTSVVATADVTIIHPVMDATTLVDSTLIDSSPTTDVKVTPVPDTGSHDVATPSEAGDAGDGAAPDSSSVDAPADVHTEDAKPVDAHVVDAKDSSTHDAHKVVEAGVTCNSYASPSATAVACNVGTCPADPLCQPNSCFMGDWCHIATGDCVKPDAVVCDGGPGLTCNSYASPSEPANKCNVGTGTGKCPSDPNCQPNSCFNGDWCHLTTGNCIAPAAVVCDGGV